MDKICILLLLIFALSESLANPRGLFLNLGNGEICLQSMQCKSKCCHRYSGAGFARCADKTAENHECSPESLLGVYYRCPCESGLTCNVDKTLVGSITDTNSDFGICKDPSKIIKHP